MTDGKRMKHSVKDTVFRDMFSKKKYLIQLYNALHPEDKTITQADLEIVTLQSILLNGIYNDLGFMVRGKQLMILVEAQSTWSANIVIRALIYLMSTYQDYFNANQIQLYGSHKVEMPKPELYVIYTGDKGNHPDVLSLKDEFFPDMDCCIDAKVKMIYLQDSDDIINQYIGFCRVCNEQVALHGRTLKAVKEIIRICRDRNLLKEYLSERETEVEEIMLTLFDQEHVWNIERNNIRAAALAEGMNLGISRGRNEGIELGISRGRNEGIELGVMQNKTQTVLKMFRRNMPVEDIADISELSVEEVNDILKKAMVIH